MVGLVAPRGVMAAARFISSKQEYFHGIMARTGIDFLRDPRVRRDLCKCTGHWGFGFSVTAGEEGLMATRATLHLRVLGEGLSASFDVPAGEMRPTEALPAAYAITDAILSVA